MTTFIGVSFGLLNNRISVIAASCGFSVADANGLSSQAALSFLWSISQLPAAKRKNGQRPVFVMYQTQVELELLFSDLSDARKDVLFGIYKQQEDANKNLPLYDQSTPEYRGQIKVYGFTVSQFAGKVLRMTQPKRVGMTLYDIAGYFDNIPIAEASENFLKQRVLFANTEGSAEGLARHCQEEARIVAELAQKVATIVEPLGLNMRQWYGPSAIAARCLGKWQARRQAKILHEKNSASELLKAIDCAYFGGRTELVKNGTVPDVNTADLNSAYAYAVTLLSQFARPLRFTRKYYDMEAAPFSCWLVEYELPETVTIGVLPTRSPTGGISFRKRGLGYFWQPEVDYLCKRYSRSFQIRWGYIGPEYQRVTFADAVEQVYQYRLELKRNADAGEKIIKLALANLYGKFAQNTGRAFFQCRAWAGWITSFIRRLLLDAVTGIENYVISFNQDAVHLQGVTPRNIIVGDGLGEWKTAHYDQGFYVAPGIYDLSDQVTVARSATRGATGVLDFEAIANDLSERYVTELTRVFFVGWQLKQYNPAQYGKQYLKEVEEVLTLVPGKIRARNYLSKFDWCNEYRESVISSAYNGQLSARYIPNDTPIQKLQLRLKDREARTPQPLR